MNVSLIVNPSAGNKGYRAIKKIETLLEKEVSLTTFITKKKGDAFEYAKNSYDADRIVAAGGDGTFNEVINGLLSSENISLTTVPLALIPIGTANVLVKELNIPENIPDAVNLALSGTARRISLGRINGRYFALMTGIGFDGDTVLNVKSDLVKKISGKAAHITAGLKVLVKYDPSLIKIKTPERELTGYTVIIGKARNYGGYFSVTPNASITEPLLDVCVFKGRTRRDLLRFIIGVLRKEHLRFNDVFYFKTAEAEIVSDGRVNVQTDGDYFGTLPVKIDVVHDAIHIIF